MKKVAVTVAVLALGLAACAKSDNANNVSANDTYTENAAETDMNATMTDTENAAGNALDSASNAIDNAGEAVENAGEAVDEAADNAAE
ncbi:MAG TPA: circumsporozoite protein [Sphingomicrobium sp.]|nr:circumsporozoite protein [Sphingomicrobium sp.]